MLCAPPNPLHIVTFFRLKIATLLSNLDKVIYLDADIVANSDLRKLWQISIGAFCMGACKESSYKHNSERLGLATDSPYINAGVLVLNLKKMREKNIESLFWDCLEKKSNILELVDQDVINLCLIEDREGIMQIQKNWNTQVRTDTPIPIEYIPIVENPYIIHYVNPDKPWNSKSKQLYKEKYLEYQEYVENLIPEFETKKILKIFRDFIMK